MSLFVTTPEERIRAAKFAVAMEAAGLPANLVGEVLRLGLDDQGVFELMELWGEASRSANREAVEADLQDAVDDAAEAPRRVEEKPRLAFDHLPAALTSVRAHKARLRALIDQHGGISAVARKAGILQPALSRMLRSGSMPRRTTLYKLARAMKVDESAVVGEWVR